MPYLSIQMACRRLPYYHRFLHRENFSSPLKVVYRKPFREEKGYTGKYQWDLIHNPQSVLFSWLEEESEGEMGSFLVSPLIEAIRKANFDKKTNLDLDQKRNYGAFTDDIKLGKEKFTYIGLRAGYSLDPKDLYKIFSETLKIDPSEYSRSSIRYENDNEKYVKYEFHQLEMTKLPAPYINTIKPGEKTVVQFVVKESEANNFEAYIYNVQNKLPMDDCEYRGYSFGNWKPNSAKYGCTRNDNDYDCNKDQIYGDRPHHGIDIYASPGTTIYAVADGEITWADVISGYGSVVALKCKLTNLTTQQRQDVIVMYAHLETISVSKGQEVKAGNVLGTTGMSGAEFLIDYPDEMHLHLEIITKWWPDGFVDRFDPSQYFKIKEPTN